MYNNDDFKEIENIIDCIMDYEFKDISLLRLALTHSSLKNSPKGNVKSDNEKLEFIGDAVLDLIVSNFLLSYPDFSMTEGSLTINRSKLVKEEALFNYSKKLNLDKFLLVSPAGRKMNIHTHSSVLADAFEALIGAIFIDSNYDTTNEAILTGFKNDFIKILEYKETNYKGKLNELVSKNKMEFPEYKVTNITGPDHNRFYEVAVILENKEEFKGCGKSIKDSEQEAASKAIKYLKDNKDVKD